MSHQALLIRPASDSDFPAIADLTNTYIVGTSIHFGYEPVTPAELAAAWKKGIDRFPFLVAETGGVFAGYAKAGVWRERAAYQWTTEVGIYITPSHHRTGIGRTLYSRLLDDVRARGFHSAIGGITLPNTPSIRLHESLGFSHIGTFRHAGWKFGAWHDVAFYQLLLRDATHAVNTTHFGPW